METTVNTLLDHHHKLEKYYRFHSRIYDLTRWSFLFGRKKIMRLLPELPTDSSILEVGCGTGQNLGRLLDHYPNSEITGLDVSESMLNVARQKWQKDPNIQLQKLPYGRSKNSTSKYDLIFFAYSLTMMGDDMATAIQQAYHELKPGGYIAVVDFNQAGTNWFQRWMQMNHVQMDGSVLKNLENTFTTEILDVRNVYLNLWNYFMFIGKKG